MQWPLRGTLASACLFAATLSWAQQPGRSPKDAKPVDGENTVVPENARGEPELGTVQQAGALVGRTVTAPGGAKLGKVDDLMLDLAAGRVAFIVIKPEGDKSREINLPPAALTTPGASGDIAAKVSVEQIKSTPESSAKMTREQLADLYRHFNQSPYQIEADQSGATAASAAANAALVRYSELRDRPVTNARGDDLGKLADFGLALDKGLIAYAAVSCSCFPDTAGELFPIPLTAFVVKLGEKSWILELPEDVLASTPTFSQKKWPEKIDRGWVEYVHVRYGRAPFGGTREELHTEKR